MSYICLRDVVPNNIKIERICENIDSRLIFYLEQNEKKLNINCIKNLYANLYHDDDSDMINFISKYIDKFDNYCLDRLFNSLNVRIVNKNNFNNLFNLIKNVFDKIKIDKYDACIIGCLYQICHIRDDIILQFLLEKSSKLKEIDLSILASNPSNLAIKIVKEQLYRISYKKYYNFNIIIKFKSKYI